MRLVIRIKSEEAQKYLKELSPKIMGAIQSGLSDFLNRTANLVREKLTGRVLKVRTGRLRSSIYVSPIQKSGARFIGKIGTNVKYAGIHEFGGIIQIPEIVPVRKQALHFFIGGKEIFAKRARAHQVIMPERSFLRTSLEEMIPQAPEIILSYVKDVIGA